MTDSRGFLRGHLWGAPRLLWVGVAVILILGLAGGFLAVHLASNNSSSGGTITTQLTGSTVAPTDSNAAQGPTASTDGSVLYQTGPGGSLQSVPTANPQQVQTVVPSGVTYFAPGPTPSEYAYVQGHTVHYGNRHRDFNGTIIRICFDSDQLIVVTVTDVERFDDGGVVIKFPGGEVAQQADFDFGGDRLAYLGGGHDLHIVDLASLKDVSYGQVDHFGSWSLDRNDVYAYVNTGGLFTVTATSENDDWQRVRVTDINISVTQVRWSSTGRVFLGSPQGLVSFDRDGNNRQDTPGDFSGHFTFIPNHPNSLAFDRGNNFSLSTNIPPSIVTPRTNQGANTPRNPQNGQGNQNGQDHRPGQGQEGPNGPNQGPSNQPNQGRSENPTPTGNPGENGPRPPRPAASPVGQPGHENPAPTPPTNQPRPERPPTTPAAETKAEPRGTKLETPKVPAETPKVPASSTI